MRNNHKNRPSLSSQSNYPFHLTSMISKSEITTANSCSNFSMNLPMSNPNFSAADVPSFTNSTITVSAQQPSKDVDNKIRTQSVICVGCDNPILEKTFLNALDRNWHNNCFKCHYCGVKLAEIGSTFYSRSNMTLCRQDYLRLFGVVGTCNSCRQSIAPDELVMRCQTNVYHVRCFTCAHCNSPLLPGERFLIFNGSLFCENEFPRFFPYSDIKPTSRTSTSLFPTSVTLATIKSEILPIHAEQHFTGIINPSLASISMPPQPGKETQRHGFQILQEVTPHDQQIPLVNIHALATGHLSMLSEPSLGIGRPFPIHPSLNSHLNTSFAPNNPNTLTSYESMTNKMPHNGMDSISMPTSPKTNTPLENTNSGKPHQKKVDPRLYPLQVC